MAKAKKKYRLVVDTERCKACGLCVSFCPRHVLTLSRDAINSKGYTPVEATDPEACVGCQNCRWVCPDAVIEIYESTDPEAEVGRT